jgi:uncharacterized membrane protein YeaQ/YmgE (transglycosylase-associated protein family)
MPNLFNPFAVLSWILMGALAGWLASIVMKTNKRQGLVGDIVVGIIGGFLGGIVLGFLGINASATGFNFGSIVVAFVGAVILLAILRVIRR